MDVLNRLIPRPNGSNGGGFKRLKHSSKLATDSAVQSADDFFAIGGPSNGLDLSADECDQFALIPATNSPKIELALVPKKTEEKSKSAEIDQQNGKFMPWKNGKEKKKPEKDTKKMQNGLREKSCEPKTVQSNGPIEKGVNGGGRRCRTLLGSILPGNNKKQEKINGGRLNLSMSEPKLNFIGNGFTANKNCGQFIDEWEGQHQVNVHGDRQRLYEELEQHKEIVEELDGGKKKATNKKLTTMAGAFQKVREKLPSKFGTNPNNNNNNSSVSSSLSNSPNSSSSSPSSSSSSSRSSIPNGIGRSKTMANGFNQQSNQMNGERGKGATNTPTLAKLRKHAKIMDIVSKKEKGNGNKNGNDLDGNRGNTNANNQQSRKPIDAQHLLLFEESLAMD